MEEELENTELDLDVLRTNADVAFEMGFYQEALDCYLKLDRTIPNDQSLIFNIIVCLFRLGESMKVIRYCDHVLSLGKEIHKDKLSDIYFYKGICYEMERDYNKAINDFLLYVRLSPKSKFVFSFIGDCYMQLNDPHNAAKSFLEFDENILELMKRYKNREVISLMLDAEIEDKDNPTLFSKVISDGGIEDINSDEYKAYKDIYIKVLEIISSLHVNNENEKSVAHYTRISTAEQLIFNNSSFRLNTILTANDPKEGLDLFGFLNLNETDNDVSSDFQAFIGSFTFNHDSLNQFRLYGKEDDKEATGISLVLNEKFFNRSIVNCVNPSCILDDKRNDDEMNDKKSLFRCIYVDPVSKQLISIGQREKWTFYRENRENIEKADLIIESYREYIDERFNYVKNGLNELKLLIDNLGENKKVNMLSELLLMLRYLTKNMAFKEEQECRVMTIENITKNPNIFPKKGDGGFSQMYINYLTVSDWIEKIYFAPKAKGREMFNTQINRFGLDIECHESTHKIS